MNDNHSPQSWRDAVAALWNTRVLPYCREHQWAIIGVTWALVYLLACVGVCEQFAADGTKRSIVDPLYRALQLFILDDSMIVVGPVTSWKLEVARFLAPTVAAYTSFVALLLFFRERVMLFRLGRYTEHVIICGLGRRGLAFAQSFQQDGCPVVIIEQNPDNTNITACRDLGMPVLMGDATDARQLTHARLATAKLLIAATGDDATNLEVAIAAHSLMAQPTAPPAAAVQCWVHVVDPQLCLLLTQHALFAGGASRLVLHIFNTYQQSARLMLAQHPLARSAGAAHDPRDVHLILAGFGQMGESIAVQAAYAAQETPTTKLRITVIDRDALARQRRFQARYPQLTDTCTLHFVPCDIEDPTLFAHLDAWMHDQQSLTTVVVAFDDDSFCLSSAMSILWSFASNGIPILVRISEESGLAVLLEDRDDQPDWLHYVHAFGALAEVCTRAVLLNEAQDEPAETSGNG